MSYDYLKDLFIDEATPALQRHSGGGAPDTRLKELVENTLTELVDDTIKSVRNYGFHKSGIQKVDLQKCISVGQNAFQYNTNLINVKLPSCTSVGTYAFADCSALTNINLSDCVTLNKGALSSCVKLTSLVLPNCETIGDNAFHSCDALERIDLGSVTKIGTKAFYGCDVLKTLIIRTNQIPTVTDPTYLFSYTAIGSSGYIYVPDNLVESYKGAYGFSTYANYIKGLSELAE